MSSLSSLWTCNRYLARDYVTFIVAVSINHVIPIS